MNWLDLTIIVVLGFGAFVGARRGFIRQIFGLAGLIGSFLMGYLLMEWVGGWFEAQTGVSAEYSAIAGFAAVFLCVQLGVLILSRLLDKFVRSIVLFGGLNRIFGGTFGVVTGCLVLSLILYILAFLELPPAELRDSSVLYEVVYQFLPQTWDLVTLQFPEIAELSERFRSGGAP